MPQNPDFKLETKPKRLWLILLLSFGSGTAALIYEVVWFQLLELVIGSTAVSVAVLLATFMGGMCLGSLALPRICPARRRALRVYALIELGIGIFGGLAWRWLPALGGLYPGSGISGMAGLAVRGGITAVCLLPPTLLMGATLPVLSREGDAGEKGIAWLGYFYGANIAGGVLGSLLSAFYLLRIWDVAVATAAAVAINLAMAGIAALATLAQRAESATAAEVPAADRSGGGRATIYAAIALSGFSALGAEAVWTRLLGLLFGASVYALALILAVFLTGLGIGSGLGALFCRILKQPRLALGWCQLLAASAIAWAAYNLSAALPYWPINPSIAPDIRFNFELDLALALWTLLPATILWGASFPLALAAASRGQDRARLMGGIYAANTAGAIAGAVAASLALVVWLGTRGAQQVLIGVSIAAGLLILLQASKRRRVGASLGAAGVVFGLGLIRTVPPVAKVLIAYGRYGATWAGKSDIVYTGEGLNSSVAVATFPNGARTFQVAGKTQASNVPRDMRLQRMLGHLTTLTSLHPRSVLVIGCGAGITAGAVSVDPRVQRETIVEIEPLVPQTAAKYFSEANFDVLRNPKVQVRIDDGRHYLLTTKEKFDGITIDPLDPWVKGAANLYTEEFLEALKQHLNAGGVATVYIQLFETDLEAVRSSVATFFEVFPNGTIWGNPYEGRGHDMLLMGQVEPLRIDLDGMEERVGYRGGRSAVAASLAEIGMNSPVDLFATYAGRKADLAGWLRGAPINHDRNLRMQYLAGLGLDLDDAESIYAGMLAYRRFPADVFVSAEGRVDSLRAAMRQNP